LELLVWLAPSDLRASLVTPDIRDSLDLLEFREPSAHQETSVTQAFREILVYREPLDSQVQWDQTDRWEQPDLPDRLVERDHLVNLVPLGLLDFLERLANQDRLETPEIRASEDSQDFLEIPGHRALQDPVVERELPGHKDGEAIRARMEFRVLQEEMEHRANQVGSHSSAMFLVTD